jgi:ABC-type nickel/cobalt efflux system permease component RcnA
LRALMVGLAVALLARRLAVRLLGALYPGVMLFVIVATGNHFWLDALAGAGVTIAAWLVARALIDERASTASPTPPIAGAATAGGP